MPRSGSRLRATRSRLDACEIALGGGEQVLPLAGALGGKIGVAADDQPLAGKIGCGNAGHVALVEQASLAQDGSSSRGLIASVAQGGDPVQAGGLDVIRVMQTWVIMPRSPTRTTWSR